MMTRVIIGGNDLFGVPFPLVVADRFFRVYEQDGVMRVDVFRWDGDTQQRVYEVRASQPLKENIERNPTGIVTVGGTTGDFLYKFRPKPGVSQIFGQIPIDRELTVIIRDRQIRVTDGESVIATFERNQISGCPIGLEVRVDGGIGMGVNRLPDGMDAG